MYQLSGFQSSKNIGTLDVFRNINNRFNFDTGKKFS